MNNVTSAPSVTPAEAGVQGGGWRRVHDWIPAYAGMTIPEAGGHATATSRDKKPAPTRSTASSKESRQGAQNEWVIVYFPGRASHGVRTCRPGRRLPLVESVLVSGSRH